jgi:hypothetical protein
VLLLPPVFVPPPVPVAPDAPPAPDDLLLLPHAVANARLRRAMDEVKKKEARMMAPEAKGRAPRTAHDERDARRR